MTSLLLWIPALFCVLAASPAFGFDAPGESVKVAGIVLRWVRGDKEANFRRLEPLVREAALHRARIVVTTECFLDGYAVADRKSLSDAEFRALGEPIPSGTYYKKLAALAKELTIYLIAGMAEADGDDRYNTVVVIGPDGKLIGKYRKQNLGHETGRHTPGKGSPVFATRFGNIGVMICADRTDPRVVSRICDNGADFLLCPSGGMFGPKTNDPILQARSRENKRHIVFVHPVEFLATGPDGAILKRTLLGTNLLVAKEQLDGRNDQWRICYFDMPVKRPVQKKQDPLRPLHVGTGHSEEITEVTSGSDGKRHRSSLRDVPPPAPLHARHLEKQLSSARVAAYEMRLTTTSLPVSPR